MARVDWIAVVYTCYDEKDRLHLVVRYSSRVYARACTKNLIALCRAAGIECRYDRHADMWADGTFEVDVRFAEGVDTGILRREGILPNNPPSLIGG